MNVLFSKTAWQHYQYWQNEDRQMVSKINDLIKSIQRTPFTGIGKPEPLRQNLKGYWSRRMSKEHRIVYRVVGKKNEGQRVEVLTCFLHYSK